ncbi:MAG: polyprenol phosphomannose-dependent alpha 1,6 mannosyltransferase MptB, partial [Jatrophihabitans sp.]|uniref:polyprenol phosphomannose-dependent alpha 1,6 mannosyltransferase MptB n=1 Tax=Jatrophihabitans sp. TaxID=1932789 RepID=UPI003F7CF52F
MHALASTDAAPTAPAERRSSGLVVAAAIGLVALVVIAVVSWTQGAVELPVHRHQRHGLERWLYFTAIAVLAFAWLGVLRAATDGRVSTRAAQLVGLLWSLPLLAAAPLGSRDAYAYVAQGNVLAHGLNPYRVGPAAVHDVFRTQVSAVWRHSTSPYGALWTEASRLVVAVAGPHPLRAAMTIRLFAFAGIVVLLLTLPRLARLAGGSPVRAVTLFALNPYVLVVGLGGAHNDVVMLGLMALGLWLALDRPGRWSLAVGAAVITVGAAVKLPAVIVLPFLPLLWVRVRKPAGR